MSLVPSIDAAARTATLWGWVGRRLALSVFLVLAVSVIIFTATAVLPGDVARLILGPQATPRQLAATRHELGLDLPVAEQYLRWLGSALHGSFGTSFASKLPVEDVLLPRGANTAALVFFASLVALPLSLLLGVAGAVRRDRAWDRITQLTLVTLASLPEFVVGLLLVLLLSTTVLHVFPATPQIPTGETAWAYPGELVLPVLALVLVVTPYLTRLVRASMIDVLDSEYVRMARLKGVRERRIIWRHALSNCWVGYVQGVSTTLIYLIGGVVTIEFLFAYPGLGSSLAAGVQSRDMPMVQAIVLVFAVTYILLNLVADLLTVLVTPRLRTQFR